MATATNFDLTMKELNRKAELVQEQIGLMQRLREIDQELASGVKLQDATPAPAPAKKAPTKAAPAATGKKKPGRPKGSKNKTATKAKAAKPAPATNGDGKAADLPTILTTIGQQVNKPLALPDFVTLVRESGYTTQAKDFSNMVYQALLKLVKRKLFKKVAANDDDAQKGVKRHYEYIGAAA